ncbi:MAG: hypothetical protein MUD12_00065 [Spirochaetes bacterium]|jgi:hypothetical protein|nr:hypothetical protein [Spirochaetota bacterium]
MVIRNCFKFMVLPVVVSLMATIFAFAQQPAGDKTATDKKQDDPRKEYNEAERPDESYLARFRAIEVTDRLMKKNLDRIYMLKVVVENFPDKGWKADFDKIYEGYKTAVALYYKRDIIYAKVKLEDNEDAINKLSTKVADEYSKDVKVILEECADKVLKLHLDPAVRLDPAKSDALHMNHMRLRIAYGQLDDSADAKKNHNLDSAIFHLRMAKTHGIVILEELAKPEEKNAIKEKYKIHKADNLSRVFEKKAAQTEEGKTAK